MTSTATLSTPVAAPARRYFTPCVTAEAEVSLSEFRMSDIVEYVRRKGTEEQKRACARPLTPAEQPGPISPSGHDREDDSGDGLYIDAADLGRISTLVVCGQADVAKAMVLALVSEKIGRAL